MMKWFEKIKLSKLLKLSSTGFLLLMVVIGVVSLNQLEQIDQKVRQVQFNWMPAIAAVTAMKDAINHLQVPIMRYQMDAEAGKPVETAQLEQVFDEQLKAYQQFENTYAGLITSPEEQNLYDSSRQIFADYLRLNQDMLQLYRGQPSEMPRQALQDQIAARREELVMALDALAAMEFQGGSRTAQESLSLLESSRRQTYLILAVMLLFISLGFLVVSIFSKSMNYLQRAGVSTCSSANQLAAVIQEQEATIGEQAASSTEIVASTKEISATAKALSNNMDEIVHIASDTSQKAEESQQSLAQLDETMHRMVEASRSITSTLAILNERASNINAVVALIMKIADQTHLLSLNAAIESERAGEYGLGFSVVATEIRRLSDQTSVATFDIEQILKEMQSSVSASVMGMDKFADEIRQNVDEVRKISQQLTDITQQTTTLSPRFEVIYEGMQAQNLGTEQITESMTQFNEGLHQTAESIRNSRQTVTLLTEASEDLQRVVKALG